MLLKKLHNDFLIKFLTDLKSDNTEILYFLQKNWELEMFNSEERIFIQEKKTRSSEITFEKIKNKNVLAPSRSDKRNVT